VGWLAELLGPQRDQRVEASRTQRWNQ
jgi:hypothetical protein